MKAVACNDQSDITYVSGDARHREIVETKKLTLKERLAYWRVQIYTKFIFRFCGGYVSSKIRERKGYCSMCGDCCGNEKLRCIQLDKNGKCSVYDERPVCCRLFPVDERMKRWNLGKDNRCTFY